MERLTKQKRKEVNTMRKHFQELFDAMRSDFCVMSEHDDSEESLLEELINCDSDVYDYYLDMYLEN